MLYLFLAGVCHSLDRGVSTARGVIGREPEKGRGVGEPKALPTPGGLPINGDSWNSCSEDGPCLPA